MTSTPEVTYTFDMASVATFKITTDLGEAAARTALDSLETISTTAVPGELDVDAPEDMIFDVTTVAPRGRAYLVYAVSADDKDVDVSVSEGIPEPITGDNRSGLASKLAEAVEALESDDNDRVRDALIGFGQSVAEALGVEFSWEDPDDLMAGYAGDENEGEPDTTTR